MPDESVNKPEWTPPDAGAAFASYVMKGVAGGHDGVPGGGRRVSRPAVRRASLSVEDYIAGLRARDRAILGRAITLVESNAPAHQEMAQAVLQALMPECVPSVRVGITGVPGAGKSTTIESLGVWLCEHGRQVAVLAVDPTSTVSRGSVLGDKTRMERLSRHPSAFIRPSPTGGTLGGVTRKSRETILLCEAFGYDTILVETVGVGQSEVSVRSMVDFFMLVLIAGAGDELQGIKKGVVELADAIAINKADGENLPRARAAKAEYARVLRYLQPATPGWRTKAVTCSALTAEGIPELWEMVEDFMAVVRANGMFSQRRMAQNVAWMHDLIAEALMERFHRDASVREHRERLEKDVAEGRLPATAASRRLLEQFIPGRSPS